MLSDKINSVIIEEEKSPFLIHNFLRSEKLLVEHSIVNTPDEYLIRDNIPFNEIIGLKLPYFYDEDDILMLLTFLENTNCDLPIIDVERKLEIDKVRVKSLFL